MNLQEILKDREGYLFSDGIWELVPPPPLGRQAEQAEPRSRSIGKY